MSAPVVLFAGGGTGGHVFPMIAVADAMRAEADVRVVFVGTARGIEVRVLPARGDELELLEVLPIKGQGAAGAMRGLVRAAKTLPRARRIMRRLSPSAVLAVGGYAAGPVGLVAGLSRVPLAILEPNSVLGLSNRWLLPFARRAYLAFPETGKKMRPSVVRHTGVPLRGKFVPSAYLPVEGAVRVLVLGGSQGARVLNDALPAALAQAAREIPGLQILHQAGRDRDEDVRRAYPSAGVDARVVPFLDDVASELARADLVIARSGAGSVAELCAVGRAAILVPFAQAADDHQRRNAEAMARAGGAVVVPQSDASSERLAREVIALAKDAAARVRMASAARALGRPHAARDVARDFLELAGIGVRRENGNVGTRSAVSEVRNV
ncbi:MAG TPA: undecaprenyldiphospho-muramoylpentapeptide beta-N-acetylglucosaminyltransferase [Polyangiaceae bacterium]|nr:undecaprenyldiphospho-muramoylpentapeptide beta-N-acetylglucosaminyltransferase [Polyangiaceae bacterium]